MPHYNGEFHPVKRGLSHASPPRCQRGAGRPAPRATTARGRRPLATTAQRRAAIPAGIAIGIIGSGAHRAGFLRYGSLFGHRGIEGVTLGPGSFRLAPARLATSCGHPPLGGGAQGGKARHMGDLHAIIRCAHSSSLGSFISMSVARNCSAPSRPQSKVPL